MVVAEGGEDPPLPFPPDLPGEKPVIHLHHLTAGLELLDRTTQVGWSQSGSLGKAEDEARPSIPPFSGAPRAAADGESPNRAWSNSSSPGRRFRRFLGKNLGHLPPTEGGHRESTTAARDDP